MAELLSKVFSNQAKESVEVMLMQVFIAVVLKLILCSDRSLNKRKN